MASNVVRLDRLTDRLDREPTKGRHVATGEALAYLAERQRVPRAVVAEWCGSEGLAERGEEVRRALTVVGDGFRLDLLEAEEALAEAVEHPLTDEAAQDARLTRCLEAVLRGRFRAGFFNAYH